MRKGKREREWWRAAPGRLVVVEAEAKEEERQGEECETGPAEEGARDQVPHAGNGGWGGRGCCVNIMRRVLRCSSNFLILHPLLQKPHNLPNCTHANDRHALLLAEHTDADAHPGGQHSGPARLGRGGGGQEEDQGDKEEESCNGVSCWLAHALEGGCDYRLNFQRGR